MILKEVMTPHVEMIASERSLTDAADRMKDLDVGVLPVKDADGVAGIVTDRDIVIRGVAEDKNPSSTPISDVMTEKALSFSADTPLKDARSAMEQHQIRRVLVVDENKDVIGIVSLGDLAVRAGEQVGGEVLQKVSDPTQPDRPSPTT